MNVLSLFDGMSCGMLAMLGAGVNVDRYVAYEIDKYAVQTSVHNFPFVEQMGDVFQADFTEYEGFDFLVGGSPCTYWSIAQTKNRETVASGMGWDLFCQYTRALHEAKPKFFIYENNKSMSQAIRDSIDEAFGFEAIHINSALVSAQNRNRLYWVGIRNEDGTYRKANIQQPEDKHIPLQSILDTRAETWLEKSKTLDASYFKGGAEFPSTDINQEQEFKSQNQLTEIVGSEAVNTTEFCGEEKSQTLKAQYAKNSVMNFVGYTSTYGATGVAVPLNTTTDGKARTLIAQYDKQSIENVIGSKGFGTSGVAERIGDNE